MKNSTSNFTVPILIICFNRPQYVNRQLNALRLVKPKHIFLVCDGPRPGNNDFDKIKEVIALYLKGIDWECKLETKFNTENLGCSKGPISAMKWFFSNVNEGIILEDDIIPSPDFFWFAKEMLYTYRDNKNIISISGCNFGYSNDESSYFFSRIMNMWGWATWADQFNKIDFELNHWKKIKFKKLYVIKLFFKDFSKGDLSYIKRWYYIWNKTISTDNVSWWDYQFIYHQLINQSLTIFPSSNLIQNIGFEDDATHTRNQEHFMKLMPSKSLEMPLKSPIKIAPDYFFESEYVKKKWFSQ